MGSIDMTKPMSAALSSAVNKSPQQQESNSWERQELNPGLLGEKHLRSPPLGTKTSSYKKQLLIANFAGI